MRLPSFLHKFSSTRYDPRGAYPDPILKDLLVFVTDRCNMRCQHCMFWQRIDSPGNEMPLASIQAIAKSIDPLRTAVLTGGEPFLRKDIRAIVETFYRDNGAKHVQVDSNGLVIEPMVQLVQSDIARRYENHLSYQVSIDGFAETHDRLRQTPGSFNKIIANLKRLVDLKEKHTHFRLVVLTNINQHNYQEIDALAQFLWDEVGVDHAYDIVRGSEHSTWNIPPDIKVDENPRDCDFLPREALGGIMNTVKEIDRREGGAHAQFVRQLEYQVDLYLGRPVPFRCLTAGRTIGTIYSDGSVAACEFTNPFAHLSDYQYDLGRLWRSEIAKKQRGRLTGCRCCHSCFMLTSMEEWERQQNELGKRKNVM
ncbi:radical SAM protein [bacterium]|nr:radical SAM protein [bacterium]